MPYQQVSLVDLLQALSDRYEGVPFWTSTDAIAAINEGLRIWNAATGFWRAPFLTTTVPSDPYVAVTGTLVQACRVLWNGVPLEKASIADFDYAIPNWRGATTADPDHPIAPVYFAPISLSLLAIYPADAAISSLIIDGVRATPVLTALPQYLDLGAEELNVLLGYALHVLAFTVGGEVLVRTYPGWQAFLKAAAARNHQFAASAYYRRLLGLDQQRRITPTAVPVPSAVEVLTTTPDQEPG